MAVVGIIEASRLTGRSRQTIWRATKAGKVSCTRVDGLPRYDTAELLRAFPTKPTAAPTPEAPAAPEAGALVAELRDRLASVEADKAQLRADLEAEREERRRLLAVIERLQLTDQRTKDTPKGGGKTPRRERRPTPKPEPKPAPIVQPVGVFDVLAAMLRGRR